MSTAGFKYVHTRLDSHVWPIGVGGVDTKTK